MAIDYLYSRKMMSDTPLPYTSPVSSPPPAPMSTPSPTPQEEEDEEEQRRNFFMLKNEFYTPPAQQPTYLPQMQETPSPPKATNWWGNQAGTSSTQSTQQPTIKSWNAPEEFSTTPTPPVRSTASPTPTVQPAPKPKPASTPTPAGYMAQSNQLQSIVPAQNYSSYSVPTPTVQPVQTPPTIQSTPQPPAPAVAPLQTIVPTMPDTYTAPRPAAQPPLQTIVPNAPASQYFDQMYEGPVVLQSPPEEDEGPRLRRQRQIPVGPRPAAPNWVRSERRPTLPAQNSLMSRENNSWFAQGAGAGLTPTAAPNTSGSPDDRARTATPVQTAAPNPNVSADMNTWSGPGDKPLPWRQEGYSFEEVANPQAAEGRLGYAWYPGAGNKARPQGYMTQRIVNADGSLGPEAPVVSGYYFWNGRYYPLGQAAFSQSSGATGWNNRWGGYSGPVSYPTRSRNPGTWTLEGVSWRI